MQEYRFNHEPSLLLKENIIFLSLLISNLNYVLYNTLDISDSLKNGLRIFAITLVIFSSLLNKNSITLRKLDFVWISTLFITLFSLNINNNFLNFIYIILILIASKGIGKEKLIEYNYKIMIISVFSVIILLGTGVLSNVAYQQSGRVRNTFGFSNVNAFSNLIYSLYLMIFMYKKKLRKINTLLLVILMYFIYIYTDTRTMIVSFSVFIIFYLLLKTVLKTKKSSYNNFFTKMLLIIVVFVPLSLSLFVPYVLKYYPQIDLFVSGRLSVFNNYINRNTTISFLFGGTQVPDIDNGYLVILFNTGIIFSLFLLYLILKSLTRLVDRQDYKSISFIVSFLAFNLTEALIIRPELSVSIIFWIIVYDAVSVSPFNLKLKGKELSHNRIK